MYLDHYKVHHSPQWELEVLQCILEKNKKREMTLLENSEKFAMASQEMEDFTRKLSEFKSKCLLELLPILEKFPMLKSYFQWENYEATNRSLLLTLYLHCEDELSMKLNNNNIDHICDNFLGAIIEEVKEDGSGDNITISDIGYVVEKLKDLELDDSVKFRLIELYTGRYTIIPLFKKFLEEGTLVIQKYFYIIKEDYDNAVMELSDKSKINALFEDTKTIQLGEAKVQLLQPNLFCFNQLSVRWVEDTCLIHCGIYMLEFIKRSRGNQFNDAQLTSDLKAIADSTRLKIIHLLSGKTMYLQEIADQLKLTPATVSHHMNLLLHAELICVTVNIDKAKKIFYELNPEKINALGESIKQLVSLQEL